MLLYALCRAPTNRMEGNLETHRARDCFVPRSDNIDRRPETGDRQERKTDGAGLWLYVKDDERKESMRETHCWKPSPCPLPQVGEDFLMLNQCNGKRKLEGKCAGAGAGVGFYCFEEARLLLLGEVVGITTHVCFDLRTRHLREHFF